MTEAEKTTQYIKTKARAEIAALRRCLSKKRIIIVPLAQKMGGKTYYLQFFIDAIGPEHFQTIGVGEIIRDLKKDPARLKSFIERSKRRLKDPGKAAQQVLDSSISSFVPDDIIFFLVEEALAQTNKTTSVILDGIPRSKAQIEFVKHLNALFFYFDTAYEVLDQRAESRRVCPKCKFDCNIVSMPTSRLAHRNGEVILICDRCGTEMVKKSGDESRAELEKARRDYEKLLGQIRKEVGANLVELRTTILTKEYKGPKQEINRAFSYKIQGDKIEVSQKPWVVKTAKGPAYALSPEHVATKMVKEVFARIQ